MSKDGRPRIITNLPEGDIKAVAALPLAAFGYSGAICLYFNNNNVFSENKISWLQLFLNTSARAIEHYIIYRQVREKARQQVSLHSVVQSLISKPEDKNLLRHIAWNTLNMLGADVVTIYEYLGAEKRFLIPPKIAGRLLAEGPMGSEVYEEDAPALLVNKGYSIYSARPVKSRIFNKAARSGARDETHPFVVRERIKSSAGILLKVSNEIVGVMFINFRRAHVFSQEEKQIIDTLTSAAAIAIKNRRLIETMGEDLGKDLGASVREIITTLDLEQVLNLIVKRAVVITGADLGVISRLDPVQQILNLAARYPPDEPVILSWTKIRMGEGITGWVALNKESMIVNDLRANDHHRPFFASDGSALCVPLQDRDGRILGVIGVKSHALSAFNRKYQRILETLANYAVIAINNAESQRQLIATETIATLGDLAGPLVHWMKNQVGSIRTYAHRIQHLEGVDDDARRISARIYSVTQRILQETKQMKSWRLSTPYLTNVNLHSLMQRIWSHVQLPAEVRVNITLPVDMPKVRGGEVQLFNVFINLIQNSLDAMQTGGELFISGESIKLDDGLWAIIKVRDTGIGITKSSLERIFDAGFSTKGGISSGLGLWWTRTYIDRLGGRIAVNSKRGKGTEFIVTLPARELE
jgi:signal transduction histidine kinase